MPRLFVPTTILAGLPFLLAAVPGSYSSLGGCNSRLPVDCSQAAAETQHRRILTEHDIAAQHRDYPIARW